MTKNPEGVKDSVLRTLQCECYKVLTDETSSTLPGLKKMSPSQQFCIFYVKQQHIF